MSTPGRLTVRPSTIDYYNFIEDASGEHICKVPGDKLREVGSLARRLAAAYNATLSVPLDVLERLDVGRLERAMRMMLSRFDEDKSSYGFVSRDDLAECRAALGETGR